MIERSNIMLYITPEPVGISYGSCMRSEPRKWKLQVVKARSRVLHCGCGRTTLEIRGEGIMFKQRDVLCRSRRHCWTDEVISFSCMICSPTDQANCIGGEEKDRERKRTKPSLFSIWLCDYSLWLVTIVMVQSQWKRVNAVFRIWGWVERKDDMKM